MGHVSDRPRKIIPARIEYYSWSAVSLFAEEYAVNNAQMAWTVCLPGWVATELGLTKEENRSDPYILSDGLTEDDARLFVSVFGPIIATHRHPDREP